ncbi:MAG: toxin-antitoxin system YwqK family antitoxin [Bacteroidetes bacterium]|nr:MAG: toxin-antitoxin system YwqK family antitoxin [Bacteroidota bacterium]MBL1144320.1 toxin-antitoxin system YwqK family antitoxin [Bacteroidota bacterium]NOG57116.1 toxin-antitoxin system YwqK family antitoxin [Bacteroidota bacterium]
MKILKLFLVLLFVSQQFMVNSQEINKLNAQGHKEGEWKSYYSSGTLRYEGQFADDKPFGVFKYYFQTGELKTVLEHLADGMVNAKHYYQNGEMMAEGAYKNQLKQGKWITYGANNSKVNEGNYIGGKKFETWKIYYTNGQVAEEKSYKEDLEVGPFKKYFLNGKLKQEGIYENGYKQGETTFYNIDGSIELKGSYYRDSHDGKWIYYNEDGSVLREIEYKHGKRLTPLMDDETPEDIELFRDKVKDELEYEDMQGTIKYDKSRK